MTTATLQTASPARRSMMMVGATAALAVAALGFAGAADARSDVSFSIGVGVPGVAVGVSNAYPVYGGYPQPVYVQPPPVYVQPRPVYVQPRPVYVQPAPVYYSRPPVYVQPAPVYYGRPHGWHGRNVGRDGYRDGGYRDADRDGRRDGPRGGYYSPAPVYYQR
jgi:hypothetical protein